MNTLRLRSRMPTGPCVRVDLRGVTPAALCALGAEAVAAVEVGQGNRQIRLGDVFDIEIDERDTPSPTLILEGDLRGMDRIGWRMSEGTLRVIGDAGDYLGCGMAGGDLTVIGNAGDFTATEMAGGTLRIEGDCGDFAAASLPGSIDGMRGGQLVITGGAGARLADRMRRGTVVVFGDVGDYAASRMVAGTLAIAGACGEHLGYGMRRGTVLCLGAHPDASTTFAATHHDFRVYWTLLRRHLAQAGGVFAELPATVPDRYVGDIAADGKGELLWFQ